MTPWREVPPCREGGTSSILAGRRCRENDPFPSIQECSELILDPYSSLDEADAGEIVAFSVGWDGHPYLVTALAPLDYRTPESGGASFPKIRPDGPQSYRIHRGNPGTASLVTTIEKKPFNNHQVQPMGHDGMLLVSCRCQHR